MFDIFIDEESIKVSQGSFYEQVLGSISLCIGEEKYFPDKNWNDFILIILEWWSNELFKVIYDLEAEFFFMDGSFYFRVIPSFDKKDYIDIIFFENNKETYRNSINKNLFFTKIKKSINILLRRLQILGYDEDKYKILQNNFKNLSKIKKI